MVEKLDAIFASTPGVEQWITIGGYSLLDATVSSNTASVFLLLDPYDERDDETTQDAILADLRRQFMALQEGVAYVFVPPAIQGLGALGNVAAIPQLIDAMGRDDRMAAVRNIDLFLQKLVFGFEPTLLGVYDTPAVWAQGVAVHVESGEPDRVISFVSDFTPPSVTDRPRSRSR